MKELIDLQRALHVPKNEQGQHYTYRTVDGILSAVKKEAPDHVYIILTDDMVNIGDKNYTKSTATIYNGKDSISASAFAREAVKLGSQSEPQISGSCSTYARKKALEGLLALDDNESDPDSPLLKGRDPNEEMTPEQGNELSLHIKDFEFDDPARATWIKNEIAKGLTKKQADLVIKKIREYKGR